MKPECSSGKVLFVTIKRSNLKVSVIKASNTLMKAYWEIEGTFFSFNGGEKIIRGTSQGCV